MTGGQQEWDESTKCSPDEAFRAAVETRAYLGGLGLDLTGDQQTKTKAAFESFAAKVAPVAAGHPGAAT
jgi:hypothetical protein